ncbi:MAG TPA: hypothetical protein VG297_07885 [Bryobacteraceae bacterium]|jgi:hypothetical protein|nr:hypothetical protein [Bryobacteraceae bacterium]
MATDAANNISLPEPLPAEHRSVEEVLADAVKRYVEERSWTKLLNCGTERAKVLGVKESDIDRFIAESRAEQHNERRWCATVSFQSTSTRTSCDIQYRKFFAD